MKKGIFILGFILLVSLFGLISAAVGVEQGLDQTLGEFEDAQDTIEEVKEGKWDYLSKEWQKIFLKNPYMVQVDDFFKNFDFVFLIFFGESYSLSPTLFFVIMLWFFFFFKFKEIFVDYSLFSKWVGVVIALGLTIVLAQMGLLEGIVEFFGWLVFTQEAVWWRVLILTAIVGGMVLLYKLSSKFGDITAERKEKYAKAIEKIDRGILRSFADSLTRAFKDN